MADNWVTVPTNSSVTIHKQTVMIHPIKDEYYNPDPAHKRSSQLAVKKGQTITGPDKTTMSPAMSRESSGIRTPSACFACG